MSSGAARRAEIGAAAWPELRIEVASLEQFIASRLDDGAELQNEVLGELALAFACGRGDQTALRIFEERYLARVGEMVRRINAGDSFADEVRQVVRVRLLVGPAPKIESYTGRGSLEGYVRVIATRAALELSERTRRESSPPDPGPGLLEDPELAYLKQRYAADFSEALSRALASLEGRQRAVLSLYLVDGLNIERIGKLYDVHRATVARWIERARTDLYEGTKSHLEARLALRPDEFQSLVRLVQSQLDVSVCRLLRESGASETG